MQDEDFFGKCETCPATGLKDTCHKSNHPKERLRGRFAICHPSLSEAPPLFYSQDGTTEEAHWLPAESEVLVRKSTAGLNTAFFLSISSKK
ncbi:hypothetical protein A6P54_14345 [Bacillus sp. MKU004]|nr:hypothetical protein A6P54_14345 [Bacillus sp. MKU004]